jgi:nucleoside-diphosphate-sugar epimerase
MEKFLVLGSSGMIGRNLCNLLKSKNLTVLEYDIKNSLNEDLRKSENDELTDLINSCDFVFFLAFDIGGAKYLRNSNKEFSFLANNTKIICNTFEKLKLSGRKFVFVSSYLSYFTNHSYGLLKFLGEHFAESLGGMVVRLYNVYGLEKISLRSHVITDLIFQAKTKKYINVMTDGFEERQFLFVDDCSDGLFEISQNYNEILKHKSIIELSSFEWTSIRHIAEIVSFAYNCKVVFSKKQADFTIKPIADKFILNFWKPKTTIKEGVFKIINKLDKYSA